MPDNKKKNKAIILLIMIVFLVIVAYIGASVIHYQTLTFQPDIFFSPTFLTIIGVGVAAWFLQYLNKLTKKDWSKSQVGAKNKEGVETAQYFDSRWVTEKELKTERQFMYCTWDTVPQSKDGIVIRNEVIGSQLHINMYKSIHTMVIGTTGTGKTSGFINPSIQILSSTKSKPSFVITDPKGELYETNSNKLRKEGYEVKVFNLRQPYSSTRWNPMDNVYMMYKEAHTLKEQVKTHVGVNPADLKLKIISNEYNHEWYEFKGVAYPDANILEQDLNSKRAELIDLCENELREMATIIAPIENKNDASWDRGAQEFIFGTMLAMLEDSLDPSLGMTRERFNFYNLARICNFKDPDPDNPYKTLRQYYQGRDKFSKVMQLISTAINNAPTTTKSYMGIVSARLGIFNDSGMCFATSLNEMNFDGFTDKPSALFIIVPDEREGRHGIATMIVSQLYQKLVAVANSYSDQKLPRNVYFLMDEFANLPKIEKIDKMITVGRSRGLFFAIVIQSFSQLNAKYGDDVAAVLKGNCPIKVFVGTDDTRTCEEFSKLCGEMSLETTTVSESKGKAEDSSTKSKNINVVSRPLIYPDELGHLPVEKNKDGFIMNSIMIVKILNEFPMKVKNTYHWTTPMYDRSKATIEYVPGRALDEVRVAYSIADRNAKVFKPKTFSLDDDI